METISLKDKIYIGRKIGTALLREIENAKMSVKIVSPYLSASYIERLAKLSKNGVKITLITADEIREENRGYSNFRYSDIIKQNKIVDFDAERKKSKINRLSALGLVLSLLSVVLYFASPILLAVPTVLVLLCLSGFAYSSTIKEYSYEYYSIFRLKVFDSHSGQSPQSTNLVHSKVFVIDEKVAFLGSANFTYSGFNTHYESLVRIEDAKAISSISQEVENLYNSTELKSKDINDWGREIYE